MNQSSYGSSLLSRGVVLVAEDDEILRSFVLDGLDRNGFAGIGVEGGDEALQLGGSRDIDLLILDRNLPGLDGIEVLRALRARGIKTPAMFLTAIGAMDERVRGLDAGADDYLAKPFAIEELLARVRALLRRPQEIAPETLKAGDVHIDLSGQRAFVGDTELSLTAQDFTLLALFLRRPGQIFSRETLLNQMGAGSDITPAAVEHAISRLRKRLEQAGAPQVIETVRGVGYRFDRRMFPGTD